MSQVLIDREDAVWTITLNRPQVRNAVDGATARQLAQAFRDFDADPQSCAAILQGAGGQFCAGADLKAIAGGLDGTSGANAMDPDPDADGPMGPTRMLLRKPVIAAVEGHAVAGGLELALWCDMRVAGHSAVFGVYCRRFGVPLIDGGTVRLPRLIGHSRALDMILTGRAVGADEALQMGLAQRVVPSGTAWAEAMALARHLASLPQECLRNDRASVHAQAGLALRDALTQEFAFGLRTLQSGESVRGAQRFRAGDGRHGQTPKP
jgi:enoyl-CoA hydratase